MEVLLIIAVVFAFSTAAFWMWSCRRTQKIREQLQKPLMGLPVELESLWKENRLWDFANKNSVVIGTGALTTAQALFHLAKIDDGAMEAIDKIYAPGVENSFEEIAGHIGGLSGRSAAAWEGGLAKYKGEVGETQIAEHLAAKGHHVELAEPNQHGWDAIVDGQNVNFKAGTDPSHIQQHLNEYPDIPVITVSEQLGNFDDNEMVHCLPHISGEEIERLTAATMEGLVDTTSLYEEIPLAAGLIAAVKNFKPVIQGKSDIKFAAKNTLVDGVSVGTGATVGAFFGSFIPVPVLGTIGGSIVGGWLGRSFSKSHKEVELNKAKAKFDESLRLFCEVYVQGLKMKADSLRNSAENQHTASFFKRYFLPAPSDLILKEISDAYRKWADTCVSLLQKWNNATKEGENGTKARVELLKEGTNESVYEPRLNLAKINVEAAMKQVEGELRRLGYLK
ncbi:MAG: hypothetical protein HN891_06820 [Planctomycetes bacterium]|nr:hypothetical protein [Planctomycetota bacterium]MBT7102735.1 hypothetical protein [Planctomycetota bacterium]MBT7130407.1 hypothetical protein [Planctomycetota bacterium]MBT7640543.1 hypothetical protein [Planctomycetota bacterium]